MSNKKTDGPDYLDDWDWKKFNDAIEREKEKERQNVKKKGKVPKIAVIFCYFCLLKNLFFRRRRFTFPSVARLDS